MNWTWNISTYIHIHLHIDGLMQDCSNAIANALELLHSCTKLSISTLLNVTCINLCSHQKGQWIVVGNLWWMLLPHPFLNRFKHSDLQNVVQVSLEDTQLVIYIFFDIFITFTPCYYPCWTLKMTHEFKQFGGLQRILFPWEFTPNNFMALRII